MLPSDLFQWNRVEQWLGLALMLLLLGRHATSTLRRRIEQAREGGVRAARLGFQSDGAPWRAARARWLALTEPLMATFLLVAVIGATALDLAGAWVMSLASWLAKARLTTDILIEDLPGLITRACTAVAIWAVLIVGWLARSRWGKTKASLWAGLGVGLAGVVLFATGARRFIALALVDFGPEFHVARVQALTHGRVAFEHTAWVAAIALIAAFVLVAWGLCANQGEVPFTRLGGSCPASSQHSQVRGLREGWRTLGSAVALLPIVVVLWRASIALAWENQHPIDTSIAFANCGLCMPGPLGIPGMAPDRIEGALEVEVTEDGLLLDGVRTELPELRKMLRNKRELWRAVNRGQHYPRSVLLRLTSPVTVSHLESVLATLAGEGFMRVQFPYSQTRTEIRPIFGRITGRRDSALSVPFGQYRSLCGKQPVTGVPLATENRERSAVSLLAEVLARRDRGETPCLMIAPWSLQWVSQDSPNARDNWVVEDQVTLSDSVEALRVRVGEQSYQIIWAAPGTPTRVLLMGARSPVFEDFQSLEQALRARGDRLIVAMNGGMFHPDRSPVGLLVSAGKRISELNLDSGRGNFFLKPNGVFAVSGDRFVVADSERWYESEFRDPRRPIHSEATQSGPLLLLEGREHPAFESASTHRAIRNAVGVESESGAAVFVISRTQVTFHELSQVYLELGEFSALYLDGNVSSLYAPKLGRRDSGRGLGPVVVLTEPAELSSSR